MIIIKTIMTTYVVELIYCQPYILNFQNLFQVGDQDDGSPHHSQHGNVIGSPLLCVFCYHCCREKGGCGVRCGSRCYKSPKIDLI